MAKENKMELKSHKVAGFIILEWIIFIISLIASWANSWIDHGFIYYFLMFNLILWMVIGIHWLGGWVTK